VTPSVSSYDVFLVTFSGGKDSLACLLHLFDIGVPREKIELWHQAIDGQEGSSLMDWPCTHDYVQKVGDAFGLPVYYSWREGGFEREMLREGAPTARTLWQEPGGKIRSSGGEGKEGTRRKFPQLSPDLSVRWCSASLKIDVAASAIRNQKRFDNKRVLYISGERREESKSPDRGRAAYEEFEPHRSDLRRGRLKWVAWDPFEKKEKTGTAVSKAHIEQQLARRNRSILNVKPRRHREPHEFIKLRSTSAIRDSGPPRLVDHWRPVIDWPEAYVWEIISRYSVNPHPAYRLGWGRVSCATCIYGSPSQFASVKAINPKQFQKLVELEKSFGVTMKRDVSLPVHASQGTVYPMDPVDVRAALSKKFTEAVILPQWAWRLPRGAFGEKCGPE
jgi:3'-phosphoadenosine 5'-phosphosulfate sulfotransferase (PAPS reductase)/FAD synthetase